MKFSSSSGEKNTLLRAPGKLLGVHPHFGLGLGLRPSAFPYANLAFVGIEGVDLVGKMLRIATSSEARAMKSSLS